MCLIHSKTGMKFKQDSNVRITVLVLSLSFVSKATHEVAFIVAHSVIV